MPDKIYIYGDSLLKATVPDVDFHYHFHINEVMQRYQTKLVEVVNRSKMGATIRKGLSLVRHDLDRGLEARYALVSYGGNDSDFDWEAVAAAPEQDHLPRTTLPEFTEKLHCAVTALKSAGVQPVLMTLPPIDGQRYFRFISQKTDGGSVLRWLGDVGRIYRHQELYSDAVAALAFAEDVPLIDVRRQFLPQRDLSGLIAADGIHLTMSGYRCLFDTLADWVRARL